MTYLYILCMAIISFSCRYAFFTNVFEYRLHAELKRILNFTAPAVLTALWAPIVFLDAEYTITLDSPNFMAGTITVATAYIFSKCPLIIVLIGVLSYMALSQVM